MRVLWVDADGNPWTDANGWHAIEDFGVVVKRIATVADAQKELARKEFDLLLVRAELKGAAAFLVQAKKILGNDGRKIVLTSSQWTKEQFRSHSKTDGAAHRYARVPMPPEGFLNLLSDLFGCSVEELADFQPVSETKAAEAAAPEPAPTPAPARKAPRPQITQDSGDLDVLRKYLSIREEQLGISESERDELAKENDRLQKEAHHLQIKLREFEHLQDELAKKVEQMEEEKAENERLQLYEKEENERAQRANAERVKGLEAQMSEAGEKYENLRVRVRKDIRKIRENERELEARLELTRKDSATLLQARDEKVLEMQRKVDALEFDLDQVQDSRVQAQMEAEDYLAKLSRVSRALQIATGVIEDDRNPESELAELEPLIGGAANAEEPKEPEAPVEVAAPEGQAPDDQAPVEAAAPESESLSPELAALASEGEPTQMISMHDQKMGGEPGSSSA